MRGPPWRAARAHLLFVPVCCNRHWPLGRFSVSCPRMSSSPAPVALAGGAPVLRPRQEASGRREKA